MAVTWTIFCIFIHHEVYRSERRCHGSFSALSVTVRSTAEGGGDMDYFLVFLSSSGQPRWMVVTWTILWSFCYHEVSRGERRCHGSFSALSVTMRSTAEGGGDMDYFLVFLSSSGQPRWMVVTWTILWSFCYHEVSRGERRCHGPFSGLSVTVRSAAADGNGMAYFLIFLSL